MTHFVNLIFQVLQASDGTPSAQSIFTEPLFLQILRLHLVISLDMTYRVELHGCRGKTKSCLLTQFLTALNEIY